MQKVIVLDFGSQYNQLIVTRVRSLGVYCELVKNTITAQDIVNDHNIVGIIFSGGPNSAYDAHAPKVDKGIFDLGLPILGICYGMQTTCAQLGGKVIKGQKKEFGPTLIKIKKNNCPLLNGWTNTEQVWMSHNDKVSLLPNGFENYASSKVTENVIAVNEERKIYLTQFHPELLQTLKGNLLLKNFLYNICKAQGNWNMKSLIKTQVALIKETVGKDNVLCALSGGVDSAVTAALIHKAIGKQLVCMFIDTGLMRKDEGKLVEEIFKKTFNIKFVKVDASNIFFKALKGVVDPEAKRKIIGKCFIDVFKAEAKKLFDLKWLAQGTLYTDIIESGTDTAHTIKSHHNVGGLPKDLNLGLVEPLKTLFKDEVRVLGKELGLPDNLVNRQPFPGPGLGVRVLGEVTPAKVKLVREADAILRQEIEAAGLNKSIWQYFTVLPNVKSVGVKGDIRSYEDLMIIRAVTSVEAMTADWAQIPYKVLAKISSRITNEVEGINRVAYDITSKPPGTIEWE